MQLNHVLEKLKFDLLNPPEGQGFNICYHDAVFVIPFNLIYIYLLIDAIFIWVGFLELILVFCNNFYYSKYGNYSLVSHEKFAEFGYKRLYKSMNFVNHAL